MPWCNPEKDQKMAYEDLDLGMIHDVFDKLGGIEGAERFLADEVVVVDNDEASPLNAGKKLVANSSSGQLEWKKRPCGFAAD